jgi:hypothetical protein
MRKTSSPVMVIFEDRVSCANTAGVNSAKLRKQERLVSILDSISNCAGRSTLSRGPRLRTARGEQGNGEVVWLSPMWITYAQVK